MLGSVNDKDVKYDALHILYSIETCTGRVAGPERAEAGQNRPGSQTDNVERAGLSHPMGRAGLHLLQADRGQFS